MIERARTSARLTVDRRLCCGSGQCVLIAPEVFDQSDDDGLVVLLEPDPPEHLFPRLRRAEDRCPSSAISLSSPDPSR